MIRPIALIACWLPLVLGFSGCGRNPPAASPPAARPPESPASQFLSLMSAGKNHLDQGNAAKALALFKEAQALAPNHPDLHLNLANSHLLAGTAPEAIREAEEVLKLEPNSAAAYFVIGSAWLRLSKPEEAVKALENVRAIDAVETATCFQLGRARMGLNQWEGAITAFKEGIALDPNHLHRAAHYLLAQALQRAGRQEEADRELQQHQASFEAGGSPAGLAAFERCKYTQARVPFRLEQPDPAGASLKFVEATRETLGDHAPDYSGPAGVIDVNHTGWNSLFVMEKGRGFRLLWNTNGIFHPHGEPFPALPGGHFGKMLVGDLQNDRFEDIVILGDQGSQVFKFATNGLATDVSQLSRLGALNARDGLLMDLDFTGKLDLLAVAGTAPEVRLYRQFGPLLFNDVTSTSGIPASLPGAQAILMEDWNRDGQMDVIVSRKAGPPMLLEKHRGGPLVPREPANWAAGAVFCTGDFDNDLRPDLAVVGEGKIVICFNDGTRREIPFPASADCRQIVAVDYDNDGWLDLWTGGAKIQAWRNAGLAGFHEQTAQLGLDQFQGGAVSELHFADFDRDGDSDVLVALAAGGLRYLRNDGGNANSQVKVQLSGNRSNASGLGCRVEIETDGLRLVRTVQRLPVEIGVGKRQKLDSFLVHWLNWPQGSAGLPVNRQEPILALELTLQEGSCPYLYAWDGQRFRFVTDILGASPLGLPMGGGRYIEADPEELVWIGGEQAFPARDGNYQLQITEELREVLYLDQAKLVVVDRAPDTEVHPTDKLLPGGPFPPGTLMTLHREHPLRKAERLDGQEVTAALQAVDGRRVSPPRLRVPQLRGLAEPHGLILDFGALDPRAPLVLVLNGWLRFGGGMANIAAAQDPSLPYPFPVLQAETGPGLWQPVDVTVGAPAGKTKTILVDLEGKLPAGTLRLRLTEAFEIHWDRIALLEKKPGAAARITFVAPTGANLHSRGFSRLQSLPPDCPLTPVYEDVRADSFWTIIPGGWCTRYGDVLELVAARDEALVLINSGDELSLQFAVGSLPPKPAGAVREFFLYADGWDKDSDFHVAAGTQVEPLPFHGLHDQAYGREQRPRFPSDDLHRKYNTRWVADAALKKTARR